MLWLFHLKWRRLPEWDNFFSIVVTELLCEDLLLRSDDSTNDLASSKHLWRSSHLASSLLIFAQRLENWQNYSYQVHIYKWLNKALYCFNISLQQENEYLLILVLSVFDSSTSCLLVDSRSAIETSNCSYIFTRLSFISRKVVVCFVRY